MTTIEQDYITRLKSEEQRAYNEMKELLETAEKENRLLTAEEREKEDRLDKAMTDAALDARARQEKLDRESEADRERETVDRVVRAVQPDQREDQKPSESDQLKAFLRGEAPAPVINLAPVREMRDLIRSGLSPIEVRDLVKVTSSAGGYTVPTTLATQLYDFLEVYSGARQTGCTIMVTGSGEALDLPVVTAHGTAAIVGEGSAAAEADPAFNKVTLTVYKYMQLLQVTSELLTDTVVNLTGFIADDMARAIARVTDADYVLGSGTNAPKGIIPGFTANGATAQTGSTGQPSFNDLVDLEFSINSEYRRNARWFFKDATVASLKKIKDSTGRPLWEPSLQADTPYGNLMGYPIITDPNVAGLGTAQGTAGAFGDFNRGFIIRDVNSVEFVGSTDYAFANDMTTYRVKFRTTSNVRDTAAVKRLLMPST